MRLWARRETIGAVRGLRTYFMTLLRNCIVDRWHQLRQTPWAAGIESEACGQIASPEALAANIIAAESSRLIAEALARLTPAQQRAVRLALEGKSVEQTAQELG